MKGEREFTDSKARLQRTVKIRWRLERVDPVLTGRVVDHHGRPMAGVKIVAKTTNAARIKNRMPAMRKETETAKDGTFRIEAWWAHWTVRAYGERRGAIVLGGTAAPNGVQLRFDSAPDIELRMPVYRLEALPAGRKLVRHFQDDVARYFEWITPRVGKARLAAALTPPAER